MKNAARPSAWPTVEQRISAITFLAGAVALAVPTTITYGAPRMTAAWALGAVYGLVLHVFSRRAGGAALGRPPSIPATAREPLAATRRRMFIADVAWLLVLAGLSVLLVSAAFGLMFAAGFGLVGLLNARWLHRWESRHGVRLFRARQSPWPYRNPKHLYAVPRDSSA
jgi:hypothetical protein